MENNIDWIIGGIFFVFFILGCFKGFLKSILGPLSLIGCWIYAMFYYNQTQKFLMAAAIAVLGPIIINFCFSLLIKLFRKIFNKEDELSAISRLLGGLVNVTWSGFYLLLMILLIAMIPLQNPKFVSFKQALKDSYTYRIAKYFIGERISLFNNLEQVSTAVEDPETLKEIRESEKFQKLLTNHKVQDLYEDPEIQELIEEKNYTALVTNPKIQELMKDKDLMMQFSRIVNEHSLQKGRTQTLIDD